MPASAALPSVAGHTTISGESGYTLVHLDAPLEFNFESESGRPSFAFHGPGTFTGIALRAEQADGDGGHAMLVAYGDADGWGAGYNIKLPAGDYRLFVLAPAGRATAEMTLPGLSGALATSPSYSLPLKQMTVAGRPSAAAPNTVLVGKTVDLVTDGVVLTDISAEFPGTLKARRVEWCDYFLFDDEAEPSAAYEPTCPGGFSFPGDPVTGMLPTGDVEVLSEGDGLTGFGTSSGPGRFGLGGNFTFVEGAPKVSATYRWLSFGSPGVPLTPAVAAPRLLGLRLFHTRSKGNPVGIVFKTDVPINTQPGRPTLRARVSVLGSGTSVGHFGAKGSNCYRAFASTRVLSRLKVGRRYPVTVSVGAGDAAREFPRRVTLRRVKSAASVARQLGC